MYLYHCMPLCKFFHKLSWWIKFNRTIGTWQCFNFNCVVIYQKFEFHYKCNRITLINHALCSYRIFLIPCGCQYWFTYFPLCCNRKSHKFLLNLNRIRHVKWRGNFLLIHILVATIISIWWTFTLWKKKYKVWNSLQSMRSPWKLQTVGISYFAVS